METNANYEELKETTKTFLQLITNNDLYYVLFLLVTMVVLVKITDLIFHPLKKRGSILASFLNACIKIALIAAFGMKICSLVPFIQDIASQIVFSSSLIVVVLGFVFQEGLTNIVHGFIISAFRPFKIGDRISVTIDGEKITGYVREITARHTVIQDVVNSAHVVVPNSRMDTSVVGNNYYDHNSLSTNFLDLEITYESNLEKAISLISVAVEEHPLVQQARKDKKIREPVNVMVRELGSSGISLRAVVMTKTIEDNFTACSEIRRYLVRCINADPELDFAYPHVQVIE